MSWGYNEGTIGAQQESADDSNVFKSPGVTYLASTGDGGMPGAYPAFSSNVVAVGGTQLIVKGNADTYIYDGEFGWSFPIPSTLNYGSNYYSQTGSWGFQSGGFSGFYGTAQPASNSFASWSATVSSSNEDKSGGIELSATWVADPSNATNATYTVYDGSSSIMLGRYIIDQTKDAVGTVDGNAQFQELGVVNPTMANGTGSVTIVLSTNPLNGSPANGRVIADAVGIAPAWAGAGGQSQNEAEPKYQTTFQNTGHRTTPDVSFDGSNSTGATCFQNGDIKYDYYGTSLACPCWAGLIAIANQGRVAYGAPTLNSGGNPMQTLQALYSLPAGDFNDVTSGSNGFSAAPGYDEVTGRGSPIASALVPDLVNYGRTTASQFKVIVGANSVVAGSPFIIAVEAQDQFGNPATDFSGPVAISSADGQVANLPSMTVTNGLGVGLAVLKTVANGPWTITASSGNLQGSSAPITVMPANAVHFQVDATTTAITNTNLPITVTALDAYGNVATNYTGTVNLTSTDSAAVGANVLGGNYTFTTGTAQDNGVHVFNVHLLTEGNQKVTVADTTATIPAIIGTSSAITTSGLVVTALTKTPTGFTTTFNQPINPADLTIYGNGNTQQDILLVGKSTNNGQPYPGTLIVDASKKLVTFNVSSNFLTASNPGGSAALPDDTYTVTLLSSVGTNGFQDVTGQGLDDGHGGHADYVGTFTTTYQRDNAEVLGITDFARAQCIRRHYYACQSPQRPHQRRPRRHSDHDLQRQQSHQRRFYADLQRQHSHCHRRRQRSVQRDGQFPDDK